MLLENKNIIVTGGAPGRAAATVRAYAREGARVASLDINDEAGRRVAAEAGGRVEYFHCDVSRRNEINAVFDEVATTFGGIDVLAHVAAIEKGGPFEVADDDVFDQVMNVNLRISLGGKPGDPDLDMAPVMEFLASDMCRVITGQVFPVDGGLVMLG